MTLAPDACIQTTLGSSEKLRVRVISSIFAIGGAHILDFVKNTVSFQCHWNITCFIPILTSYSPRRKILSDYLY